MLTTVTNAQIDAAAALVPAPYGPLTRVTDVEATLPEPNSDLSVEFTSALTVTVFLSYEQITDSQLFTPILINAHSGKNVNAQLEHANVLARVIAENMKSFSGPPYTDVEMQLVIDTFRTLPQIVAQPPNRDTSYSGVTTLKALFTANEAADPIVAVTDASTGDILMYAWDWGDDTPFVVGSAPANHTYAANGTYTITLYIVGRAGYSTVSHDVTIAGVV